MHSWVPTFNVALALVRKILKACEVLLPTVGMAEDSGSGRSSGAGVLMFPPPTHHIGAPPQLSTAAKNVILPAIGSQLPASLIGQGQQSQSSSKTNIHANVPGRLCDVSGPTVAAPSVHSSHGSTSSHHHHHHHHPYAGGWERMSEQRGNRTGWLVNLSAIVWFSLALPLAFWFVSNLFAAFSQRCQ
jgi:hypothetical protein